MSRLLYIDAFSGAAGDMLLGAFLDAGLPADELRRALGSLGVEHELRIEKVVRAGISAVHVDVADHSASSHAHAHDHHHEHGHDHAHGHHHAHDHDHDHHEHSHDHGHDHSHGQIPHAHGHRTIDAISELIRSSGLSADGKTRAIAMIRRLAEAEAAIHNVPVSQVHLHEVGAVDSIIDIVGAVFAFEWFGIDDIVSSPLNVGSGTVTMAHGVYPVPAPATLRLLQGVPIYSDGAGELLTPTGALVISTFARAFGTMPRMTVDRVGYGAGTRDVPNRPNVVRVALGERIAETAADAPAAVVEINCEIDDMSPQLFAPASERLLAAGALDVFLTPIVMKKGRPGALLTVLGEAAQRARLLDVIFRETTTIGVRTHVVGRDVLPREWEPVTVGGATVRIKVARRGGEVLNAMPEFEDCVAAAASTGRSVKAIQADALRAWWAGRPS